MKNALKKPGLVSFSLLIISMIGLSVLWTVLIMEEGVTTGVSTEGIIALTTFVNASIWIGALLSQRKEEMSRWEAWDKVRSTFLTQKATYQKLQNLAVTLDALFKAQVSLQSEDSSETSLDTMTAEIARLKSEIAVAKSAFWKAHKLADDSGFSVYERYDGYLPR